MFCLLRRRSLRNDGRTLKGEIEKENGNYHNLTQEELEKKIQKVKTEIEQLKTNNQNINSSEWQIELQKKKEELAKLEKLKVNNTTQKPKSDNSFPIGWVVGSGIVLLTGLVAVLVVREIVEKKKAQSKK